MFKTNFFAAFFLLLALASEAKSVDLSVLDKETWSFSPQQSAALNSLAPKIITERINRAVNAANGGCLVGIVQEFKVIDLNADGIYEIIARIDYSGRGRALGLAILSRQQGRYYYDVVSTWGVEKGVAFSGKSGKYLIVGTTEMGSWCMVDPPIPMPILYEWTGTNCVDVSKDNKDYYKSVFVPDLTNRIAKYSVTGPSNDIDRHDEAIKLAQLALLIPKIDSMFQSSLVPPDVVRTLSRLMASFHLNKDERKDVVEQFRDAQMSLSREEGGSHGSTSTSGDK